jgi:hypothetical protein
MKKECYTSKRHSIRGATYVRKVNETENRLTSFQGPKVTGQNVHSDHKVTRGGNFKLLRSPGITFRQAM